MYNNKLEEVKQELESLFDEFNTEYGFEEDITLTGEKVYFCKFKHPKEEAIVIMTTVNNVFNGCTSIPNKVAYFKQEGLTEEQIIHSQPIFSGITEDPEVLLGLISILLQESRFI
jgi:hypothetical protein